MATTGKGKINASGKGITKRDSVRGKAIDVNTSDPDCECLDCDEEISECTLCGAETPNCVSIQFSDIDVIADATGVLCDWLGTEGFIQNINIPLRPYQFFTFPCDDESEPAIEWCEWRYTRSSELCVSTAPIRYDDIFAQYILWKDCATSTYYRVVLLGVGPFTVFLSIESSLSPFDCTSEENPVLSNDLSGTGGIEAFAGYGTTENRDFLSGAFDGTATIQLAGSDACDCVRLCPVNCGRLSITFTISPEPGLCGRDLAVLSPEVTIHVGVNGCKASGVVPYGTIAPGSTCVSGFVVNGNLESVSGGCGWALYLTYYQVVKTSDAGDPTECDVAGYPQGKFDCCTWKLTSIATPNGCFPGDLSDWTIEPSSANISNDCPTLNVIEIEVTPDGVPSCDPCTDYVTFTVNNSGFDSEDDVDYCMERRFTCTWEGRGFVNLGAAGVGFVAGAFPAPSGNEQCVWQGWCQKTTITDVGLCFLAMIQVGGNSEGWSGLFRAVLTSDEYDACPQDISAERWILVQMESTGNDPGSGTYPVVGSPISIAAVSSSDEGCPAYIEPIPPEPCDDCADECADPGDKPSVAVSGSIWAPFGLPGGCNHSDLGDFFAAASCQDGPCTNASQFIQSAASNGDCQATTADACCGAFQIGIETLCIDSTLAPGTRVWQITIVYGMTGDCGFGISPMNGSVVYEANAEYFCVKDVGGDWSVISNTVPAFTPGGLTTA